jgi:hypothetical protein
MQEEDFFLMNNKMSGIRRKETKNSCYEYTKNKKKIYVYIQTKPYCRFKFLLTILMIYTFSGLFLVLNILSTSISLLNNHR